MTYTRRESFLPFTRPVIGQEEIEEMIDSIHSGWITTGPKSARFEEELARYNGVKHCLAMNSATTAQEITLQVLDLQPGDEVITTAMTWVSTLSTVVLQGGVPVLADIDPKTLNIDPARIEEMITPRTKGIIPVHLTGLPAPMEDVWQIAERHGLWVIEDEIRTQEKQQTFGPEFIRLARAVYFENDDRSRIKKDINLALGSAYVEEKSYEDYRGKA